MTNKTAEQKRDFLSVSLLFFTVSFIGWLFETAVCFVGSGRFCDRGFLSLPFCPIYGAPVCIVHFLLGKPSNGFFYKLLTKKSKKDKGQVRVLAKIASIALYYVSAALLATLFELVIGLSFESAGLSLWSYGGRYSYKGVISLDISLCWGALMTFFGQFPLPWLEKKIISLSPPVKRGLTAVLWTAVLADFAYNVAYYFLKGKHFDIRRYFQR